MENNNNKPFYMSKSVWSLTGSLGFGLTIASLVAKSYNHSGLEALCLGVVVLANFGLGLKGRVDANDNLTILPKQEQ